MKNMIRKSLIIAFAVITTVTAQNSANTMITSTTTQPLVPDSTTTASTTKLPSETVASSLMAGDEFAGSSAAAHTTAATAVNHENCSTCISSFETIYLNSNFSSTSLRPKAIQQCPPVLQPMNDSCFSFVRDNCSDVMNLIYTLNSNLSLGLTCSESGFRVIKWTDCSMHSSTAKMINESNAEFCGIGNFSCFADHNGILSINKIEVLEPLRKYKRCMPTPTTQPTIPLLPNPVGPSAITAIVVLICLFIVGVLAGFFF